MSFYFLFKCTLASIILYYLMNQITFCNWLRIIKASLSACCTIVLSFLAWAWQAVWISFGSVCIGVWAWVGRTGCWVHPAGLRSVGLRAARCQMPAKEQAGGGTASLNDASHTVLSVSEAFSSCDINQCCYCDGETSDTIIYLYFPPSVSLSLTIIHALFSARSNPC